MNNLKEYYDFLEHKKASRIDSGFDISEDELGSHLFPFQKYCVRRALAVGRFAMFEDCGLGKTIQQLEWAHQVIMREHKSVIILAPLAVVGQTIQEGVKFGYSVREIDSDADMDGDGIYITNYDNMDNISADPFVGVVLDESSIL